MPKMDQEAPARSWSRVDGIDLLRGLAIFFVLMNHVNMQLLFAHVPYTRGLPKQVVATLVWNGQQGVQIFFAVSGFLITTTSLRRWKSLAQVSAADFYRLRFARIAPLLMALLAVLSVLHLAHVEHFVVKPESGGLGRALVAALTFHVNLLEARRGYLPGSWDILWSLSVEETFYFAFPWVCRWLGRGRLMIALLLVFVALGPFGRAALTHGNPVWREYSYLGGMDAIAMGCLTAIALNRQKLSRVAVVAGRRGWDATAVLPVALAHRGGLAAGAHGAIHERNQRGSFNADRGGRANRMAESAGSYAAIACRAAEL